MHTSMLRPCASLLLLLAAATPAAALAAQQFPAGALYMMSDLLDLPPNQIYTGIRRIDPATGTTFPFVTFVGNGGIHVGGATYDPFRDRIVVAGPMGPSSTNGTHTIDAAGNWTNISPSFLLRLAPRGDGKIYGYRQGGAPAFVPRIHYLDQANGEQTLLDVGGTAPWGINGSAQVFGDPIKAMIYEPHENALFVAFAGDNAAPSCSGTANFDLSVRKLPLTSDGTALRAAPSCVVFSVSSQASDIETPLTFSHGPQGSLVLAVATNSSGARPRFLRIDPATLAVSTFATVGPYLGDIGFSGGAYCPTTGRALLLDGSIDAFRAFAPGDAGGGTLLGSYGPAGFGTAPATFFVTGPIGPGASLTADTFALSASLGGVQNYTYAPGAAFSGDSYLIVGTLSGWSPGLPLGNGLVLPINFDVLTDLSLQLQNTPILVNTAGTMPVSGQINAQFHLPPGVLSFLTGWNLHFAGFTYQSLQNYTHVSNPVPLTLLP
jgi:hypothetical protein